MIGLVNANFTLSEKGFYATTFVLSLFGAIVVQKNTRDEEDFESMTKKQNRSEED